MVFAEAGEEDTAASVGTAPRCAGGNRFTVRRFGDRHKDLLDHLVNIDSFGICIEIGEDAVPEHRVDHFPYVFGSHGKTAVEDRSRFGRQNDVLRRRGPAPHANQFFTKSGLGGSLGRVARTRSTA